MIKSAKPFFLFLIPILIVVETFAQGGTLNGVFAGVEVSLPTVMGQGMDRTDRVIYLMAAINGSIFFMEEEKESEAMTTNTNKTIIKKNEDAAPVTDARTLLYNANRVQGGSALDNIRSIRARATVSLYTITSLVDLLQKRLRIEIHQGGTLQRIEQFDSNGAWQWENGKKKPLPADRLKEMKNAFESGVLALRRSVIDRMTNLEIKGRANGKTAVIGELDGVKHAYLFNDRGELIGDGYATTFTDYSNLKTVSGILFPFSEKQKSGTNNLSVTYTEYEINPAINESAWATQ